jgi:hypothetical protein
MYSVALPIEVLPGCRHSLLSGLILITVEVHEAFTSKGLEAGISKHLHVRSRIKTHLVRDIPCILAMSRCATCA